MRILEVGTGDGANTIALATDLPADGLLITIESDAAKAAEARERFKTAGFGDRISVIVGEPARFLHKLRGPFDLIVDRDPHDSASLHDKLLALLAPGGVLIRGQKKYSQEI